MLHVISACSAELRHSGIRLSAAVAERQSCRLGSKGAVSGSETQREEVLSCFLVSMLRGDTWTSPPAQPPLPQREHRLCTEIRAPTPSTAAAKGLC
ncbi:hypothetical protein FKM82_024292 [Ascaphus truei]